MGATPGIREILETAVAREEEAHRFYTAAAGRVADRSVRETFEMLAREELGHRSFLLDCLGDPGLIGKLPVPADHGVAEATEEPELSIDMKPADALALAMRKEKEAADFYNGLAAAATDPALGEMFRNVANMELNHKARLETMFVDIGYPEVF